jgi:gliotoxin/aspirochlorine biosynthesis peptide synthetase
VETSSVLPPAPLLGVAAPLLSSVTMPSTMLEIFLSSPSSRLATMVWLVLLSSRNPINTPFDVIRSEELIRVSVSPEHMLVVVSHIICDLTTLAVLLREVADTYHGSELTPVSKTYFQTTWSVPAAPQHLEFWSKYLNGVPRPTFPIGNNSRKRTTWVGSSHVCEVDEATYQGMINFASVNKVTIHQLAIAAVTLALHHDSEACDIVVGAPYLNRNSEEDMEVIGLFLEPLPIRIRYPPRSQEDFGAEKLGLSTPPPELNQTSFIRAVQQSSRAALSHVVPWDQLLSHLKVESDFPNHPIFDTMVTFHEADHGLRFPIKDTEFLPTWSDGAKFKLMVEFTARDDGTVSLRLEYSTECFTAGEVQLIGQLVLQALDELVAGSGYHGTLRRLRATRNNAASHIIMGW